ncbi:GAF domain-containing protein [Tellurirhabdus rosea]|uniref:GAF domain-containing protein n=1 Tax=Tellurirhabdus rosea TaxID=2674997 RepID=UPI002251B949|nr:GAF domain-containing protein [Tellurirhabdus rosea]
MATLPAEFEALLHSSEPPEDILERLVRRVGEVLKADRCFLYVRRPHERRGRIMFCWRKDETIPDVIQPDWQEDTTTLPDEDPLFNAALTGRLSVYVDDVETAPPTVLNREFEHRTFGHRALIHAHATENGQLWGILQPAVFGKPRHWTDADRSLMEMLLPRLVDVLKRQPDRQADSGR